MQECKAILLLNLFDDFPKTKKKIVINPSSFPFSSRRSMLTNWKFDDIWFFQGNIHLRNIQMPAFKVCLIYDPATTEKSVEMYGALKFSKINRQFCPNHMNERSYSVFHLEVQELKAKLPTSLLSLCETSAYLTDFDDKMNEYCVNAQNKVKKIHEICRKTNAQIKEEYG